MRGKKETMISMTQLRKQMETASLSDEGLAKLNTLLTESQLNGFLIVLENSFVLKLYEVGPEPKPDVRIVILSSQDMAALDGLRQLDTGIALYSNGATTSVVPMFIVYNDALDEPVSDAQQAA
jgi:hypothetical protein